MRGRGADTRCKHFQWLNRYAPNVSLVSDEQAWVRIDECGRLTGDRFVGSLAALQARLVEELGDVEPEFTASVCEPMYLEHLFTSVDVRSLTMKTPWGTYRWIEEPPAGRPSLRHRLAAFLHEPVPGSVSRAPGTASWWPSR